MLSVFLTTLNKAYCIVLYCIVPEDTVIGNAQDYCDMILKITNFR